MGEIIRILDTVEFGGSQFNIELNRGTASPDEREIHVQNEKMRLAIPEHEFLQMAAAILLAKRQLDIIKGKDK